MKHGGQFAISTHRFAVATSRPCFQTQSQASKGGRIVTEMTNGGRLPGIALILFTIALVILALVYGRSFLIPIIIAFLITTLIGAAADRLNKLGLPRNLATLTALAFLLAGIAAVIYVLASQVDAVSQAWPRYIERFQTLANSTLSWVGPQISGKITEALSNLDIVRQIPRLAGSVGGILATIALVMIYVGFLLAERGRISGKIQLLFEKPERARRMQRAMADISESIRRYLLIKTIMSLLTAGVSYVVLKMIGVDFAETWTLLIFLLKYIPSIGSILGVIFPALLVLVQFDTLWQFFFIAVLLSSAQLIIGNVIEPTFMGRTLNLSPFVVIASLAFWSIIWGPVGAFLSVPLTTTLVIACSHVPSFRWIAVLLSADGQISVEPYADKNERTAAAT
jgi:predicted PurR-regulated permease PerM